MLIKNVNEMCKMRVNVRSILVLKGDQKKIDITIFFLYETNQLCLRINVWIINFFPDYYLFISITN